VVYYFKLSVLIVEVSTAIAVESTRVLSVTVLSVASLEAFPWQATITMLVTAISDKMYFFMFVCFCIYYIDNAIFVSLLFYLQIVSAIEIDQGDKLLYLAFSPIDSIRPTAALRSVLDWYLGSGLRSMSI
jgi:hypothetical protein